MNQNSTRSLICQKRRDREEVTITMTNCLEKMPGQDLLSCRDFQLSSRYKYDTSVVFMVLQITSPSWPLQILVRCCIFWVCSCRWCCSSFIEVSICSTDLTLMCPRCIQDAFSIVTLRRTCLHRNSIQESLCAASIWPKVSARKPLGMFWIRMMSVLKTDFSQSIPYVFGLYPSGRHAPKSPNVETIKS